jgi:transcriptional regulator with XRE-family HTH domain
MNDENQLGRRLKWWRERRGLSQLDLAGIAGTSQRHLSFIEGGRTRASRDMVLRLAVALDLPLRQQNALLLAAGFAPAWRESGLDAPALAQVSSALDLMLAQQEPYPALVVDRRWNLLRANNGAVRLTEFLLGALPPGPINMAEALVSPAALRPTLVNWEEVALYFVRGVQADALADGTAETQDLLRRLLAFPGVDELSRSLPAADPQMPVLVMHFCKDAQSLRLFTTLAILGTPQDVTVQEIRIESFFPADPASAGLMRSWAQLPPT